MKRYKLIKEYPGSLVLNTEIKYTGNITFAKNKINGST